MSVDVLIIGGGPAGLTAAHRLREQGVADVLVVEREAHAGGIPRHSDHTGYGIRDLRTVLTGPAYASRLVERALDSGAQVRTSTMVTGWDGDLAVLATGPGGRERIEAGAIVLATGARERPRTARRIPGDRPAGVLTTGLLQQLVHLQHRRVGERAVVVGSELVSWSAVLTLREVGCEVVAMTTTRERPEAYGPVTAAGRLGLRVPIARRTRVVRVIGHDRVTGVEIENLQTGARRVLDCDTVVFTADWIPDSELARTGGLDIDPGHLGPVVDGALRTSRPGVFAAGNVLHPVDTADVAALDGRHVADHVVPFLDGHVQPKPGIRVRAGVGLDWVTPGRWHAGEQPPRGRLLAWASDYRPVPTVVASQAGEVIARRRLPWPAAPGRVFRIPSDVLGNAHSDRGDVTIGLT